MLMLRFLAYPAASSSILWDMVPVKSASRSGLPMFCIPRSFLA